MKNKYKMIVDKYVDLIRSGELTAGTRLPTHRDLAASKRISLATATRVYAELETMGLVSGEIGREPLSEKYHYLLDMVSISMM